MALVAPELTPRTEQRKRFALPVRVELAENDLDTHDRAFSRMESKLDKLNARATGLLISMTTATLLLAIDVVRHV